MTKTEFAKRMGILSQNVNKLLSNPTESSIRKIADVLEIPVWQLFVSPEKDSEILPKLTPTGIVTCPVCGSELCIDLKPKDRQPTENA